MFSSFFLLYFFVVFKAKFATAQSRDSDCSNEREKCHGYFCKKKNVREDNRVRKVMPLIYCRRCSINN